MWAKDRLVLSRGDYHWQHEPCWYAVREGRRGHRTDDRRFALELEPRYVQVILDRWAAFTRQQPVKV